MTTRKDLARLLEDDLGPLTFGRFLRGARTTRDMTQVELARLLGLSRSTLCDIEKGRQVVSAELAAKIARKCGLSEVLAVEVVLTDQLRRAKLDMRVSVQSAEPRARSSARSSSAKLKRSTPLAAKRRRLPSGSLR